MALRLLMRGGIYILFIAGIILQWVFRKLNENKQANSTDTPDNIVIDDPVANLSQPDRRIRLASIHMLAENPVPENIPLLIDRLADTDYEVREATCYALIEHGEDALVSTIEIMKTGSLKAREMAIQVLAGLPAKASIIALEHALIEDESAWVRIPATEALANIGSKSSVPTLIRALQDEHRDVYDAVVIALNQIGTLEGIQAIADNPYHDREKKTP